MGSCNTEQAADSQDSHAAAFVSNDGISDQTNRRDMDDEPNEVKYAEKSVSMDVQILKFLMYQD